MTFMPSNYQTLTDELTDLAHSADSAEHLMTMIVERLQELLTHYNWVGFYMLDEARCRRGAHARSRPLRRGGNAAQAHPFEPGNLRSGCFFCADRGHRRCECRSPLSRLFDRNQVRDCRSHLRPTATWSESSISTATFQRPSPTTIANSSSTAPASSGDTWRRSISKADTLNATWEGYGFGRPSWAMTLGL